MNTIDMSKPLPLRDDQRTTWRNFAAGITFDEAAEEVMAAAQDDGERADIGVGALSTWAFGPGPDGTASLARIPMPGRDDFMVPLRRGAFSQLCGRINAPAPYIASLPAKLQMACVNYGMQGMAETAGTLRLASGEARALLSDRYTALDNEHALETMRRSLRARGMLGDVRVKSLATGRTFSMRMTLPGEAVTIDNPRQVGDVVETGLELLNGELGNRAISITPITWRLVCLNGMRRADREQGMTLRHAGDPERLRERFDDAIPAALASSKEIAGKMATAVDRLLDDVLGDIGSLRAFGLSKRDTREVARDVAQSRGVALPADHHSWSDIFAADIREVSAYEVMNGITHYAQQHDTDKRLDLEEAAARYVTKATR